MGYRLNGAMLALIAWGCGSSVAVDDDDGAGGTGPSLVGVQEVAITKVSLYQAVERPLAIAGASQPSDVPIISGRDALIRVFYEAPEAVGREVIGRLELSDGTVIDTPVTLGAGSSDPELASTVNFHLDGAAIAEPFSYRVSILESGDKGPSSGTFQHPHEGFETHAVAGGPNKLRIVLVPFQYNADGSGRLPNLSEEQTEIIRNRFRQLYPVSDVELTVRAPVPWSQAIMPNGSGWQQVGLELFQIRQNEAPSPDHYYYGIFNPTATIGQFCGQGCLLGVTLLNNEPADVGNPQLRLALGVGFDDVAADTAAHEIGHAHGRSHANCGLGLDPQSIDPSYPHPGGLIGTWGYDIVSRSLRDPNVFSDIMGYCDEQFISDYNFKALFHRGSLVNQPDLEGFAKEPHAILSLDEHGKVAHKAVLPAVPFFGPRVAMTVVSEKGSAELSGHFFAYDHLPGGWLIVPAAEAEGI